MTTLSLSRRCCGVLGIRARRFPEGFPGIQLVLVELQDIGPAEAFTDGGLGVILLAEVDIADFEAIGRPLDGKVIAAIVFKHPEIFCFNEGRVRLLM